MGSGRTTGSLVFSTNEEKTAVFYLLEAKASALNAGYDKANKVFA